jgi:hypothetical protein
MLRAIGKISVKIAKRFDKKMAFFVDFALFFRTIDDLLRCGTIGYGMLENSDKNGLPTV